MMGTCHTVHCFNFVLGEIANLNAEHLYNALKFAWVAYARGIFATQNFVFKNALLENVIWNVRRKNVCKFAEEEIVA